MKRKYEGEVVAVCRSEEKGTRKSEIESGELITDFGLKGDAHAGDWHRQISLLGEESILKMKILVDKEFDFNYGDFAENITTSGIFLYDLPVGSLLKIGDEVLLEVTQIGKECHHDCEIYKKVGMCIMPSEGIFARVKKGGEIKAGDKIEGL